MAEDGKRISYRVDALQSRINLYEMCRERDAVRLVMKKIIALEDGEEAHKQLQELLAKMNWNSSNYPADPKSWDALIKETQVELIKARNAYVYNLNKSLQPLT